MQRIADPTPRDPVQVTDPLTLFDVARARQWPPGQPERAAVLDRLEALIGADALGPAPPGRDWQRELWAERALDAASADRLAVAMDLSDRVLDQTGAPAEIATARATLARGRALAWQDTEADQRAGSGLLVDASRRFSTLGRPDWQGLAIFWHGQAVGVKQGRAAEAEALVRDALEILAYSSPGRASILDLYAEVLVDLGEWDRADLALDEAFRLAETADDAEGRARITWTRAHVAGGRGDAVRAERLFLEVERDDTNWWQDLGAAFLCDAAQTLDMLGLTHQARGYLRRAEERLAEASGQASRPPEEFRRLALTRALVNARSADPAQALQELWRLDGGGPVAPRLLWRHTLLSAWARLRAGDRETAGLEAARALAQAVERGGIRVATAAEPDITAALAPLAAAAGSAPACGWLARDGKLIISLFGKPQVLDAEGRTLELPAGRPGELVRMLAVYPHGLPVEVVLEEFFPGTAPTTSRHRLRQVLTRLRSALGEVVIRDGEMLILAPAWVDVQDFAHLVRRARASRGTRSLIFSHAAGALAGRGPLLLTDTSASWAQEIRRQVEADIRSLTAVIGSGSSADPASPPPS